MRSRVGVLMGDPCGIGPELVARLVAEPDNAEFAEIVVVGDHRLLERGAAAAGVQVELPVLGSASALAAAQAPVALLDRPRIEPDEVPPGRALASAGRYVLESLEVVLGLFERGIVDALCYAPINKQALRLGGSLFPDELHVIVDRLGHEGRFGEINTMGGLWTTRVTSHVPLAAVSGLITEDAVFESIELAHATLCSAGYKRPRIAVAALNPHAGDGGLFGREEIDVIAPAVAWAREEGIEADGPFPSDTVFVKAREGAFDAVVTMYHDQGQIAMKLMGFERGVTVFGGLPVAITTPAHGTAFDIAGRGIAHVDAMREALRLAAWMGASRKDETA